MQPSESRASSRVGGAVCGRNISERHLCSGFISHRLVRRIADDTDIDRACDTHQPDSVHPVASELAIDDEYAPNHGDWSVFAFFAAFVVPGVCASSAVVLVAAARDAGLLC